MPRGGKREGAGRKPKTGALGSALMHIEKAAEQFPSLQNAILGKKPDALSDLVALIRLHIPAEKIVKRINEGLDATETKFFQFQGEVQEQHDVISYGERRQYAALAAELGAYHTPVKPIDPQSVTNQQFVFIVGGQRE